MSGGTLPRTGSKCNNALQCLHGVQGTATEAFKPTKPQRCLQLHCCTGSARHSNAQVISEDTSKTVTTTNLGVEVIPLCHK